MVVQDFLRGHSPNYIPPKIRFWISTNLRWDECVEMLALRVLISNSFFNWESFSAAEESVAAVFSC